MDNIPNRADLPLPPVSLSNARLSNTSSFENGNYSGVENHKPSTVFSNKKDLTETKKTNNKTATLIILLLVVLSAFLGYDKVINGGASEDRLNQLERLTSQQQETIVELEGQVADKEAILQSREDFVAELDNYSIVLNDAKNIINTSSYETTVEQLIAEMFEETTNSVQASTIVRELKNVVANFSSTVKAERERIGEEEAKRQAAEALRSNLSGTIAEQALDDITGGRVNVTIGEGICSSAEAVACVSSADPNTVRVETRFANDRRYDYTAWYSIMMHEYAHVIQFSSFETLNSSNAFVNIFDSDYEWHADCMAEAIIGGEYLSGYNYFCSPERLDIARQAWDNNFL